MQYCPDLGTIGLVPQNPPTERQRDYFVDTANSQQTTSYCTVQQPYNETEASILWGKSN